jgi:hypothetical protein
MQEGTTPARTDGSGATGDEEVKVTAIKQFRRHVPGETFEMADQAARVFIKARVVRAADYETDAVKAESVDMPDEPQDISPRTGKPKRTYKRRDVQAEA